MPTELQNEAAVLAAVRGRLAAERSGDNLAGALATLVAETSHLPLRSLDRWERLIREELWTFDRKPTSARWKFMKKPERFASWLDLCSSNGFWRERILRTLTEAPPNDFFYLLIVRRLNDWVPQVRAAAREYLIRTAALTNPEHVVDALWSALANFVSWGRMTDTERQALADLIATRPITVALKTRIMKATDGPVSQILSQAGRTPVLDEWLEEFSRSAIRPSVRAKAYRCLLDGQMTWVVGRKWRWTDMKWCKGKFEPVVVERALTVKSDFPETLRNALADKSALVRRVGAEFLIRELNSLGDAAELAGRLASDRSPSVAERGRFALAKLGAQA